MFTLTVFEILLSEGRSVLSSAQWAQEAKGLIVNLLKDNGSYKKQKLLQKTFKKSKENSCNAVLFLVNLKPQACNSTQERLHHGCFPVSFKKYFKKSFFTSADCFYGDSISPQQSKACQDSMHQRLWYLFYIIYSNNYNNFCTLCCYVLGMLTCLCAWITCVLTFLSN